MDSPHNIIPYNTYHIPSPRALYAEVSPPPHPRIDLRGAVHLWYHAAVLAKYGRLVESLEEHLRLLRNGARFIPRAPIWFNIGSLWASTGDLHRATDAYEISTLEDSSLTIAWFSQGVCLYLLEDYGTARNSFDRCSLTFTCSETIKGYDHYGLRYDIEKTKVAWNIRIAQNRYEVQRGQSKTEFLDCGLNNIPLNLFLEPDKTHFDSLREDSQPVKNESAGAFREGLKRLRSAIMGKYKFEKARGGATTHRPRRIETTHSGDLDVGRSGTGRLLTNSSSQRPRSTTRARPDGEAWAQNSALIFGSSPIIHVPMSVRASIISNIPVALQPQSCRGAPLRTMLPADSPTGPRPTGACGNPWEHRYEGQAAPIDQPNRSRSCQTELRHRRRLPEFEFPSRPNMPPLYPNASHQTMPVESCPTQIPATCYDERSVWEGSSTSSGNNLKREEKQCRNTDGFGQICRKQNNSDLSTLDMFPSDSDISQPYFDPAVHGGRASVCHAQSPLSVRHIRSCSALGDSGSTPTLVPSPTPSVTTGIRLSGSGRKRRPSWGGFEIDSEDDEWSNQPQRQVYSMI